jgi:hypothetical protein
MALFSPRLSLRARMVRRLPELAELTLANLQRRLPAFAELPPEVIAAQVLHPVQRNLDLVARLLAEARPPEEADLGELLQSVARRAEERVPLANILGAYYAGIETSWHELTALAEPGEARELGEIGDEIMAILSVMTLAVTETYVETATAMTGRERDARARLMTAILANEDTDEDWGEAGLVRWRERTVAVWRNHPKRPRDAATTEVTARRLARDVRQAVEDRWGAASIVSFSSNSGVLLLPGRVDPEPIGEALGGVLRGKWYIGHAQAADGPGTGAAHSAAESCADVPERLDYPSGVYGLKQLLTEVQATRPGPARAALLEVLVGLEDHADLLATLAAHIEEGGRRTETAKRLHIHPNTLDYRLRRIRELTGVDPVERDGAQLLRSAMIARTYVTGARDLR